MTLAEKAYHGLRHDIVRGAFAPGSPLRLADLAERYGMGFSPLREALNRLGAERLVTSETLRGFRVAPLSLAEFEDALATRLLIETEALRLSIARGGDDWAAAIVAALYALKLQADRSGPDADLWELEARHHAFHRALLAACGSDWMLDFFERLYHATERYRLPVLLASTGPRTRDIEAEHKALADATLARTPEQAVALLRDHYLRTADTIRATLATAAPTPDKRRRA
ncbi:MAG: FCD domain-containing protein [Rhodobacter sp.]|uniref:FCD domain-containing protein n=1 Tax=Pararhodobacter sp. TaxID=2127056 RepID=UPI001D78047F|nr:FCD domain-containing protein [Pararhodobacter sp.]MCB1346111.1 FCD domain-containing protein [Paracoccaceae bacterium]MCC0073198.1 FCD domain-containing protein [Rhodobacter sp.]HPD91566.1 FCD domain-containing protein [Pararhodobacter sp.]